MSQHSFTIESSRLSIDGLQLSYQTGGRTTTATFDPLSTCNLFKETGLIEDFTSDSNGEPVVLYTDPHEPTGYGYDLWCSFVTSFPLSAAVAELLAQYIEERKMVERTLARIHRLLSPLQATA